MQLNSSFTCNSVIWITSLPDTELGPSRRMTEDVASHAARLGFHFSKFDAKCRSELVQVLDEINFLAREYGIRPILVLDAHASQENGLLLGDSGEMMAWTELSALLQQINVSTLNNLCVIGAACFSLHAISPTKLDQAAPFFVLLAPEQEVNVGFLEKNLPAFFDHLFTHGSLDDAYNCHLFEAFKYFHCEKMLFIVVARYIKAGCKGKPAAMRRERLMTEVFMQGMQNTKANRKAIRKKLKAGLKPNQALLDRYAQTFLVGRSCSFTIEQLLAFLDAAES
ncbi:hypothetical protein H5A44_10070 [Pectobacterium brasiliense]|nr:hypothetical protein [Pectobacterium brasiliense]